MKKGKLIVIDGVDGSGKATQTKLLVKRLRKEGNKTKTIDFPRYYDNFFGGFIGECLAGKHGDFLALDPYITSVIYAADRFESGKQIKDWLAKGYTVVIDRYVSANQIHQGGKIEDAAKRKKFISWIENVEFNVFKIPKPDLIIYLDVSIDTSEKLAKRTAKHKKKRYLEGGTDAHEDSRHHLEMARRSAVSMVRASNRWVRIECMKQGGLLPKEEIHTMVWDAVRQHS